MITNDLIGICILVVARSAAAAANRYNGTTTTTTLACRTIDILTLRLKCFVPFQCKYSKYFIFNEILTWNEANEYRIIADQKGKKRKWNGSHTHTHTQRTRWKRQSLYRYILHKRKWKRLSLLAEDIFICLNTITAMLVNGIKTHKYETVKHIFADTRVTLTRAFSPF